MCTYLPTKWNETTRRRRRRRKSKHFSNFPFGNVIYLQKLNLASVCQQSSVCARDDKMNILQMQNSNALPTALCFMKREYGWSLFILLLPYLLALVCDDSWASGKVTVISVSEFHAVPELEVSLRLCGMNEREHTKKCRFALTKSHRLSSTILITSIHVAMRHAARHFVILK